MKSSMQTVTAKAVTAVKPSRAAISKAKSQVDVQAYRSTLDRVISPLVEDRWKGLMFRGKYKPSDVADVLNSAYGTRIHKLCNMFEMMEETWPRLGTNLQEIRTSVSRLDYDIKPHTMKGAKPTASAQERAKLVEEALFSMTPNTITGQSGFVDTVYNLMDAYGKGFCVLEIDWRRGEGGSYMPAGTRWIKPVHYDYPWLPKEEERLMLDVDGAGVKLQDFPENKFIVGRFAWRSGTTSTTQGCLRLLAPWWVYTNFSTEWLMSYCQIFGMPIRIGKYQNVNNLNEIANALEKMGSLAWGVFPVGTELELHESSKSAADNPQAYVLERTDELADKVILGNTLTSGTGAGGKSLALGEVHERTQEGRVGSCGQWVCETISNQLIRAIVKLNYGDEKELPTLTVKQEEASSTEKIAVDEILIGTLGLEVSKEWLYDRYGIPQPAAGDEVFVPLAKSAAADALAMKKTVATSKTGNDLLKKGSVKPAVNKKGRVKAKLAELGTPDIMPEVAIEALELLPDDMQDHYIDEVSAAHFKGGQPGGGRFMPKDVQDAQDFVRGAMKKFPAQPPTRGRRHLSAFGIQDTSLQFSHLNTPDLFDRVDAAARKVKCCESVPLAELNPTQSSVDADKVMAMLSTATNTEPVHQSPIVIKRGGKKWLWDGHHRAVKAHAMKQSSMMARVVDMEDASEK